MDADDLREIERRERLDRIVGGTAWAVLIITTVFFFCGGG
jgi:hypothetical protein